MENFISIVLVSIVLERFLRYTILTLVEVLIYPQDNFTLSHYNLRVSIFKTELFFSVSEPFFPGFLSSLLNHGSVCVCVCVCVCVLLKETFKIL